ncbi:glycosyltransferase [Halorubrum tibetense]|uniref:Glycosyltransferase n=1 Tax=Halorubrum tibetense TaxID=175631 RepID=A0ABD5S977_9EURY
MVDENPFEFYYKRVIGRELEEITSENNVLWYYYPIFSFIPQDSDCWDAVVYDCSDNHTTSGWKYNYEMGLIERFRNEIGARLSQQSEIKILKHTDIVFTSSQYLYAKLSRYTDSPIYLEETGVDLKKFETTERYGRIEQIEPPRLGFVGKMKQKIDYQLLGDVARKNPSWNIVLVGPDSEGNADSIRKISNVTWIGAVDPDDVPQVMNSLDVGLMPYREIEYNKAVFPLKFHEYLASGLPVVGCGLPSTERYVEDGIYLHTAVQSCAFADACSTALSWENTTTGKKELAQCADWTPKVKRIHERVSNICESDENCSNKE